MKTKITFLAVFLTLFLLTTAHALPLSLDGGTPGEIPGGSATNELLVPIYGSNDPRAGTYGATVMLDVASEVTFTYLGKEAAYRNLFLVGGQVFNTDFTSPNAAFTLTLNAGVIPFIFKSYYDGHWMGQVANGSNPDALSSSYSATKTNFFVSWDDDMVGSSLIAFLDDTGFNNDDDNHDDMAIRISVQPVPEPATLLLLGVGLAGLTRFGRRQLKKR